MSDTPANLEWKYLQSLRRADRDEAEREIAALNASIQSCPDELKPYYVQQRNAATARFNTAQQQLDRGNLNYCLGGLVSLIIAVVVIVAVFASL